MYLVGVCGTKEKSGSHETAVKQGSPRDAVPAVIGQFVEQSVACNLNPEHVCRGQNVTRNVN